MQRSEGVAIFWDYENCPVPANASGYAVVDNIRSLIRPYGSVKSFKAYLQISEQVPLHKSIALRSELQSSGVSLVDCPHNGRKDVADKMIIVDMLAHAIDNPAPSTLVLITGDRDFAYALSILKLRRYRLILITLPNAHRSLTAQASVRFEWTHHVLGQTETSAKSPHQTGSSSPREISRDTVSLGSPHAQTAPLGGIENPDRQDRPAITQAIRTATQNRLDSLSSDTSTGYAAMGLGRSRRVASGTGGAESLGIRGGALEFSATPRTQPSALPQSVGAS